MVSCTLTHSGNRCVWRTAFQQALGLERRSREAPGVGPQPRGPTIQGEAGEASSNYNLMRSRAVELREGAGVDSDPREA